MVILSILKTKLKKQSGLKEIDKCIFDVDFLKQKIKVTVIHDDIILNSEVPFNENADMVNLIDFKIKKTIGITQNEKTDKIIYTIDYKKKCTDFSFFYTTNENKKINYKGNLKTF